MTSTAESLASPQS